MNKFFQAVKNVFTKAVNSVKTFTLKVYNKVKEENLTTGIIFAVFGAVIILVSIFAPSISTIGGCVIGGMLLLAGILSFVLTKLEK